ncbi:mismatch repair protein MSH3 Ecym_6039 [Eremothecium cymbalariae DBVPG|uniref:DNA mismatch repair protein MSH3 n=1 Tax=Eremothecium cymbalariae (strain CBS 270.75 / DBVPG 7215 / KCTC 17166 / NRRL Y-17582) TaxID=931890 RepID=G8JUW4_ERECY|nr:hypothetical protein Ecym_6039 [Eremothecium cymbalariae DBVPG\
MLHQPTISRFFRSNKKDHVPKKRTEEEEAKLVEVVDSDVDECLTVNSDSKLQSSITTAENSVEENEPEADTFVPINESNLESITTPTTMKAHKFTNYKFNNKDSLNTDKVRKTGFVKRLDEILQKRSMESMLQEDNLEDVSDGKAKAKKQKSNKLTELDQQFKDLKLRNMDKVLVVRVGYKYKFFAEDAVLVSQLLQIKLVPGKLTVNETNPNDIKFKQFAYCTIPDVRLEVHLQRLIHHNLKVGLVEQTETSAVKKNSGKSNSVFSREVTSVFTRATYGINEIFGSKERHVIGDSTSIWGLVCDVQTIQTNYYLISVNLNSGEVFYDEFKDEKYVNESLETRITYLNPSEVVTQEPLNPIITKVFSNINPDVRFIVEDTTDADKETLGKVEFEFDTKGKIYVAATLVHKYLSTFNNQELLQFKGNYKTFSSKTQMTLSSNAFESLDIFINNTSKDSKGSLLWLLDHTRTPFGFRLLKNWISKPLIDVAEINKRLDAVECISSEIDKIFIESLNNVLRDCQDLERILNRVAYGRTSKREVYLFLRQLAQFASLFKSHHRYIEDHILSENGRIFVGSKLLSSIFAELHNYLMTFPIPKLLSMINVEAALDKKQERGASEYFNLNNYDNAEALLSKLRDIDAVVEELHEELKNIRVVLKRPMMNYQNETDFLIEVRNTQIKSVPSDWVKVNSTKMVSRFRTPVTTKLSAKLQYHKELLENIAEAEYAAFLKRITNEYVGLKSAINKLATYDCILSLAATSVNVDYVRPKFSNQSQYIKVKKARNPIIESLNVNYIPNDVSMSQDGHKIMVITGPNMGGKSSYVRQVALLVIIAQIGCFVPAEYAEFSIFDRIFTRIGAHDNLLRGDSTFKVEMTEVLHILKSSTPRSLLLLDEVGRGTGTHDGISISYAILTYFIELRENCPLVLFITHYTALGNIKSEILSNYHMSFIEEHRPGENWPSVTFLYKLQKGQAHNSYGLNVAKLANVPTSIINRAYQISEKMKKEIELNNEAILLSSVKRLLRTSPIKAPKLTLELVTKFV